MYNQSNIYQPGFNQGAGMQSLVPNRSQIQRNPLGDQNQMMQQNMMQPPFSQPMQQRLNQQINALQSYKPQK